MAKFCEGCGRPLNDDDIFCTGCGRSAQAAKCGNCGAELVAGDLFCKKCGAKAGSAYAYPPQQAPAQPYNYPTQQAPAQPYGQPVQGFAPTPIGAYGATAAPTKRSPILGLIALALVVISGIVLSLYAWQIGSVLGAYVVSGTLSINQYNQTEIAQQIVSQLGSGFAALGSWSIGVGFVGWILGIVATATKRGRAFGVLAIILGILAPIVAFVLLFVVLGPYMS